MRCTFVASMMASWSRSTVQNRGSEWRVDWWCLISQWTQIFIAEILPPAHTKSPIQWVMNASSSTVVSESRGEMNARWLAWIAGILWSVYNSPRSTTETRSDTFPLTQCRANGTLSQNPQEPTRPRPESSASGDDDDATATLEKCHCQIFKVTAKGENIMPSISQKKKKTEKRNKVKKKLLCEQTGIQKASQAAPVG